MHGWFKSCISFDGHKATSIYLCIIPSFTYALSWHAYFPAAGNVENTHDAMCPFGLPLKIMYGSNMFPLTVTVAMVIHFVSLVDILV